LNGFGIGDRRAAEFLDNHKEQILYGKAGVAAGLNAGSPIAIVVFLRDQAIVAARLADDFVVLPVKFVHFRTLAIEGRDRFFVLVR
jgi:uncharacterized protein (DUF2062 family)